MERQSRSRSTRTGERGTISAPLLFLRRAARSVVPVCIALIVAAAGAVSANEVKRFEIPIGDSPAQGPADAPVTIVEFLDFQ